jgi:bifunctional DNase/RNase
MKEKRIKLRVQGITGSQIQSGAYALVLAGDGMRRLPIIIGMFEAQSIAIAMEGLNPPRPLTHDLFIVYTKMTGFSLKEVFIHKFNDGVFYSEIVLTDASREIRLDARTSDAVAIALRGDCDIFTTEAIMQKCSILFEESSDAAGIRYEAPAEFTVEDLQNVSKLKKQLRTLKKKELRERMAKAVSEENYEFAKIYKDELLRREEEDRKP